MLKLAGEDGGKVDFFAGKEDLIDDFLGVREVAIASTSLKVCVEG